MRRGYHAFSYQHIAAELSIKPAAVHYHFRTKADLILATIERYGRRFDDWEETVTDAGPSARLLAYVEVGQQMVVLGRVCALGMLNTQFETVPEPVQHLASTIQRRVLAFYSRALEEGRAAGEMRFEGSAEDTGAAISCALIGAQQLARAFGPTAYDTVMQQQTSQLGLSWPATESRP